MNKQKIDFSKMSEAQANTEASAIVSGMTWSTADREYLKEWMYKASIEEIALALGRTAYSVETMLCKDPEFLAIRKENGDVPSTRVYEKKVEEKQYFVSSDLDVLFGAGD